MSQQDQLKPLFHEFVENRAEQLALEASKLPEFIKDQQAIDIRRQMAEAILGEDDTEKLISVVRGQSSTVYEYCYRMGVVDGIWLSGRIDQMQRSNEFDARWSIL